MKPIPYLIAVFLTLSWSQVLYSTPPSNEVLKEICSSTCSGKLARIIPWAEPDGTIRYYEFFGDLRNCSHPPLIVYDAQGKPKLTIPEHPVDPSNKKEFAQDQKLAEEHKNLLKDLKETKPIFCESH